MLPDPHVPGNPGHDPVPDRIPLHIKRCICCISGSIFTIDDGGMGQLIPEPVVQAGLAIQQCAFLSVEVVLQIVKGFNGVQRRQLPGGSTGCKQVL